MQVRQRNIYQTSRANAGLSQEAAAELLELSVETVRAYETGLRTPTSQTVRRMAEAYGAPGLRLEHARETDELGLIPREAKPRPLEQIALRLCRKRRELAARELRLAEIAEDGEVDEAEQEDFSNIQAFVADFVADCLALQVCEGTKNDRPEAATSKRSGLVRYQSHKNYCNTIIAHPDGNARENCAGTGVVTP